MAQQQKTADSATQYVPKTGTVVDVVQMTELEKFLTIAPEAGVPLAHKPGQFLEVSMFGTGEAPISICSSPTEEKTFGLCVRNVGNVTNKIHELKKGDPVAYRGPYGNGFDVDEMKGSNMLFVAGGLGLAPARSLINYVLDKREDFADVTILYGARSPKELLFKDDLKQFEERNDVNFLITVDHPDDQWKGNTGVITTLFRKCSITPENTWAVVIGPPVMYKFVILEILSDGIPEDRILCSLERRMKCGLGKCGHCQIGNVYVCQEGPVFSYSQIKRLKEGI